MTAQRIIIAVVNFLLVGGLVFIDWTVGTHLATFLAMCVIGALAQSEIYPMFRRMGLDSEAAYGVMAALVLLLWRGLGGYTGLTPSEVQVRLFELALVHIDVGERRRELPRQDSRIRFAVGHSRPREQLPRLIVFTSIARFDRQVVQYLPHELPIAGLLRPPNAAWTRRCRG